MAYTVKYHGYEVTCDTVADVSALVNQNGDAPLQPSPSNSPAQSNGNGTATGVAGLVAKLPADQRELLRYIATAGIMTRDALRQKVGVSDTHRFAGLLISISKSAAGIGIKSPIEKVTVRIDGRGPRVYQYKIRDNAKAEIKEALTKL